MEMTKWFDTNYHYIVPEFEDGPRFRIGGTKLFDELARRACAGIEPTPVLHRPGHLPAAGQGEVPGFASTGIAQQLLPVYGEILQTLAQSVGAQVQIDEPCLVTDLSVRRVSSIRLAIGRWRRPRRRWPSTLATYFGDLGDNRRWPSACR